MLYIGDYCINKETDTKFLITNFSPGPECNCCEGSYTLKDLESGTLHEYDSWDIRNFEEYKHSSPLGENIYILLNKALNED